jgi:hypothetical protein
MSSRSKMNHTCNTPYVVLIICGQSDLNRRIFQSQFVEILHLILISFTHGIRIVLL